MDIPLLIVVGVVVCIVVAVWLVASLIRGDDDE